MGHAAAFNVISLETDESPLGTSSRPVFTGPMGSFEGIYPTKAKSSPLVPSWVEDFDERAHYRSGADHRKPWVAGTPISGKFDFSTMKEPLRRLSPTLGARGTVRSRRRVRFLAVVAVMLTAGLQSLYMFSRRHRGHLRSVLDDVIDLAFGHADPPHGLVDPSNPVRSPSSGMD